MQKTSMGEIIKTVGLFLTLIIAMSYLTLLMVKPANAQSIPSPSVPQFTVKFVKMAYNVPETYGVAVPAVNFTFKNPPFTPYTDQNGNKIDLNYLIDWKRPSDRTWIQYTFPLSGLDNNTHSVGMYIDEPGIPSQTGQIEFKIAAQITYLPKASNVTAIGETSNWSSIQTITIPASSSSPTPSVPEFCWLMMLPLFLSIIFIVVLFRKRKVNDNHD
jgi:hypothetical protein